jgi:hypothetical protein
MQAETVFGALRGLEVRSRPTSGFSKFSLKFPTLVGAGGRCLLCVSNKPDRISLCSLENLLLSENILFLHKSPSMDAPIPEELQQVVLACIEAEAQFSPGE